MTIALRPQANDVEKAIDGYFAARLAALPGKAAVAERRAAAFDLFRAAGLPHRRVEAWKYTDLRGLLRQALPPSERPSQEAALAALHALLPDPLLALDRFRVVLIDGYYFPAFSDRTQLAAAGVEVASLADRLADGGPAAAALLAPPALARDDVAVALNTAFAADGVILTVRDGADIGRPIEIMHLTTTGSEHAVTARNIVDVGAGAAVRIVETYVSAANRACQTNVLTRLDVGRRAAVSYARLQAESEASVHLGSTVLALAEAASVKHLSVSVGGRLARSQVFLTTGGQHTRAGLYGATMAHGAQHADATLVIDHALPGAETRVLYKSAVDGDSRGVFQGKIVVEQDAQKTDARMMSQALLLSDASDFASKPELEIYADDVQCGHGATAGEIDEDELFYLMARGIERSVAEELLIAAFLDDAIDALEDPQVGEALKATVAGWLARRKADK